MIISIFGPYQEAKPPVPTAEATVTITLPGRPVPPAEIQNTEVDDDHSVSIQTVFPTCAIGVKDSTSKFIPVTVSAADPEVGAFGRSTYVSAGVSYEKAAATVPSSRSMAARTARAVPVPPAEVHRSELVVVHDVVKQTVLPTCAVGVEEPTPKFVPENISVADPEVGPFGWYIRVITGASNVNRAGMVPTCACTRMVRACAWPDPESSEQTTYVVDVHVVERQRVEPISAVTVGLLTPKFVP